MRELKFQAYVKPDNKVYPVSEINFMDGGRVEVEYAPFRVKYVSMSDVVLRQYTGLKDRNGREIYEGDILTNKHKDRYIVRWSEVRYMLELVGSNGALYAANEHYFRNCEINGNVFEHPHLLEVTAG